MASTKDKILVTLKNGFSGSLFELAQATDVSVPTTKKHLNALIGVEPILLTQIIGFLPEAKTLVDFAESKLGPIRSSMLMAANIETKKLVDNISQPELRRQFGEGVKPNILDGIVTMSFDALFDYVANDFLNYVSETGNGAVAIVGRLNEEIILRALKNSGLVPSKDFQKTGTQSDGDIIISRSTGTKKNLYVEVKSYHARERLLRGLTDIDHPEKVGIGFFRDPSEFNAKRTQTLINTSAWAIYIPEDTFEKISPAAKAMTTARQDWFYRPLAMFVDDMTNYSKKGELKPFRP